MPASPTSWSIPSLYRAQKSLNAPCKPGVPVQLGSTTDIANLDAVAVPNGVLNTPRGTLQGVEIDVETQPIHSQAPLPSHSAPTSGQLVGLRSTGHSAPLAEKFTSHCHQYGGWNDSPQDWKPMRVARIEHHSDAGRKLGEQVCPGDHEERPVADVAGRSS
jgi:hypothetical protein